MFAIRARSAASAVSQRAFSTSRVAQQDVARLILVGRLSKEPEVRVTRSEKEYVTYTVGTTNYPPPPPGPDGARTASTTWHRIMSFNPNANNYLRTLPKGALVYVEANYEMREPQRDAEAGTPESQRQVFLRHDTLRLLKRPDEKPEDKGDEP